MNFLPGWNVGMLMAGAKPTTLVHVHNQATFAGGSSNPSYTQTGCNFGTADATRRLFLVIAPMMFVSSGGPKNVTIGGVAATLHVQDIGSFSTTGQYTAIFSALVPTGTSGTVYMDSGNGSNLGNVSFALYASYNQKVATPFATSAIAGGLAAGPGDLSLNVPDGGFVLALHAISTASSVSPITMVSDQPMVRDLHDTAANTQGAWYSGSGLVAQSPMSLTTTYIIGGNPLHDSGCAASFV